MEEIEGLSLMRETIYQFCEGRFRFRDGAEVMAEFEKFITAANANNLVSILQLRREGLAETDSVGRWKTIILAYIDQIETQETDEIQQLEKVITVAAYMRSALKEAEPYDLYLFLTTDNPPNIDVCMRLESTEQFCKKYVKRAEQSIDKMLERTFLSGFEESEIEGVIEDPLDAALKATNLSSTEQENWRDAFLSGAKGDDLIDQLFGKESIHDENE